MWLEQLLSGVLRQGHVAVEAVQDGVVEHAAALDAVAVELSEALHVLLADAQLLAQGIVVVADEVGGGDAVGKLYEVCVLHVVGLLIGLSVEIDDAVAYLESLTGQTHAALDVVLLAVDGPVVERTEASGGC